MNRFVYTIDYTVLRTHPRRRERRGRGGRKVGFQKLTFTFSSDYSTVYYLHLTAAEAGVFSIAAHHAPVSSNVRSDEPRMHPFRFRLRDGRVEAGAEGMVLGASCCRRVDPPSWT